VIVGSTPSRNGMAATAKASCLLVLDSHGRVREMFSGHGINGPWDATAISHGRNASLFVTDVLNGTVAAKGDRSSRHRAAARAWVQARHAAQPAAGDQDRVRLRRAD
jgi:hypothetical protein